MSTEHANTQTKAHYWNCWTNNMYNDGGNGAFIIHMFEEPENGPPNERALCGVRWAETGLASLSEVEPGCIKCRRILRKRGLLR